MKRIPIIIAALFALCLMPLSAQAPAHPVLVVWTGDFLDASGTDHPNAVIFPASIAIDQVGQQVGITDYVYASASVVQGIYSGKTFSPVGQHSYTISKADFPAVAAQPVVNGTVGGAIFAVCAQVATQTQDVPDTNTDGTPKMDAGGKPVLKSWVSGWQMETLDLVTGQMTPYAAH